MSSYHTPMSACDADDPARLVFIGMCGYWTDDWDKVSSAVRGIPVCPNCGAPGFEEDYGGWMKAAEDAEGDTHKPGYAEWLRSVKETCSPTDYNNWPIKEQEEKHE